MCHASVRFEFDDNSLHTKNDSERDGLSPSAKWAGIFYCYCEFTLKFLEFQY